MAGMGQMFQSASQALGILGNASSRGSIAAQLGIVAPNGAQGLGSQLQEQVDGETDEQRRKRLRDQQQGNLAPGGGAAFDLFGGMGGLQY